MTLLIALVACKPDASGGATSSEPSVTSTAPEFTGRPTADPSGTCPDFADQGTQDLTSNGVDRQVEAYWPAKHDGPIGMMYAWHGLGDRADSFVNELDLDQFAKDHDILVIVPWSENPDLVTWNYLAGGGDDLQLVEDVRNCAAQSFDLDESRVWSMGFSFGALWTTFLTMQESDILAGTVTFSGGTGDSVQLNYFPPLDPIPVLTAWGGDNDQYNAGIFQVNFAETTADFADNLEADGHTVVRCDHGLGHTVPPQWDQIVANFLLTERFGQLSSYASGDVSDLPDYCFTP